MDNKPHDVRPENAVVFLANLVQQKCGKRRRLLTPDLHNNNNTMSKCGGLVILSLLGPSLEVLLLKFLTFILQMTKLLRIKHLSAKSIRIKELQKRHVKRIQS